MSTATTPAAPVEAPKHPLVKFNRKQYMNKEIGYPEYMSQFVTATELHLVARRIGIGTIVSSIDPHFNDIALRSWDILNSYWKGASREAMAISNASTTANFARCVSLADCVGVMKAAARQIKENVEIREELAKKYE